MSGIYWKNKDDWKPALLTTNFLSKYCTRQSNFRHICEVLSHDIARYLIALVHKQRRLETFVSMDLWVSSLHCPCSNQNRMRRESFSILGLVIWQLEKEISEFWTRFWNIKPSHRKYIFLRLLSFKRIDYQLVIVRPINVNI